MVEGRDVPDARPSCAPCWPAEAHRIGLGRTADGMDVPLGSPGAVPTVRPSARLRVMLAAGEGRRTGHHTNKVLLPLAGRRVFTWSIQWARLLPEVCRTTVLVIREQDRDTGDAPPSTARSGPPDVEVVVGGDSRHGSEWEALQVAGSRHRGRRDRRRRRSTTPRARWPLTTMFADVIDTASTHGRVRDPGRDQGQLAALDGGDPRPTGWWPCRPRRRSARGRCSTPTDVAEADGFIGTDTASCIERYTDEPVLASTATRATSRSPSPTTCSWPSGSWRRPAGTCPVAARSTHRTAGCDVAPGPHPHRRRLVSVELADLHCETCDRVTEHELHYSGRLLESMRCTRLRHPPRRPHARHAAGVPRRTSSSGWSASRAGWCGGSPDPGGYARQLPRAIARQPAEVPRRATVDLRATDPAGSRRVRARTRRADLVDALEQVHGRAMLDATTQQRRRTSSTSPRARSQVTIAAKSCTGGGSSGEAAASRCAGTTTAVRPPRRVPRGRSCPGSDRRPPS